MLYLIEAPEDFFRKIVQVVASDSFFNDLKDALCELLVLAIPYSHDEIISLYEKRTDLVHIKLDFFIHLKHNTHCSEELTQEQKR